MTAAGAVGLAAARDDDGGCQGSCLWRIGRSTLLEKGALAAADAMDAGEAAAVPLLQGGEEALERFAGAIWSFGDMAPLPWPLGWWCDLGRKVDDIS